MKAEEDEAVEEGKEGACGGKAKQGGGAAAKEEPGEAPRELIGSGGAERREESGSGRKEARKESE